MKEIDIFICSFERQAYTEQTIKYLRERTKYPYRLFLLDNGGNSMFKGDVDYYIGMSKNMGIHAVWNMALSLAESDYFITSDNDIYVPDLRNTAWDYEMKKFVNTNDIKGLYNDYGCWLTQLQGYMTKYLEFGAISLHPHVFIGAAGIDPNDPEDVKDRNMCGAVMRIMRTDAVRQAGGWEHIINAKRNHEERTICSRLHTAGFKTGICSRIRAYHPFGGEKGNWGYPEHITPEMQGHTPELKDYVKSFDQPDAYDSNTWLPKT